MAKKGPARCHPGRLNNGQGLCAQCYYITHKDRIKAQHRDYYVRNRAKAIRDAGEWRKQNSHKRKAYTVTYWNKRGGTDAEMLYQRRRHLRKKYGLTIEGVEAMMAAQGGKCGICASRLGAFCKGTGPQVDHDHATGEVRAVLCHHCNKLLGHAKENPQILTNAAHYLMAAKRNRKESAA